MGINKIGGVTLEVSAGNAKQMILIDVSAESGDLTTGAAKKTFRLPYNFNLSDVRASVNTAPVGSNILVDINQNGTSILNTKINIDVTEESSTLSDTSYSLKNPFLSNDDEITVDIDQVGSSTAGSGLKLMLIGTEITASDALYHLSASATTVDEFNSVVFNMHTFNVADSTTIPYTISGIAAGDITQSLTGNFTISSNVGSKTINLVADETTEGAETMTMTSQGISANVSITDTSVPITYSLSANVASVNEGGSIIFTMNTTGIQDGTSVPYTISGVTSGDITQSLTGNFTINSNTGTTTINITEDTTTEGAETLTMTSQSQTANVTINDTSLGATFNDNKCITGLAATWDYLGATTNLPTTFTHASDHQYWTIVMHFEHDTTTNSGFFDFDFGSNKYIFLQNFGATLFWLFYYGDDSTTHAPMVTSTGEIGDEKVTLTLTATGDTVADIDLYVNGGSAHNSGQNQTVTMPKFTSSMTTLALGRRDTVFHFNGKKFNDFAIFGVAFTEAQATEAYNSGTTLDMTTHSQAAYLEHYWLMGDGDDGAGNADGSSSLIYDMEGSCDLTMNNMDSSDIVDW
tara:strand:+ start:1868 stop:3601 length:1734 start_codon:yes stop_codon:yes gene_type:complete